MKKIGLLVAVLVLCMAVNVSAVDLGYFHTNNVNGISVKSSEGVIRPQIIGQIYSWGGSLYVEAGLRGLYFLNKSGAVERYLSVGVNCSYSDGGGDQSYMTYGGHGSVGIEFPLGTTPFLLSVELGISGQKAGDSALSIGNNVGAGIHYRF